MKLQKLKDETGRRYERLTVVERAESRNGAYWHCLCDCGNRSICRGADLRRGKRKSCGCLRIELAGERCTTHGLSRTGVYSSWSAMNDRCYRPDTNGFENYGGRGVEVCLRWRRGTPGGIENFVEDMGRRPEGMTLDRIDVNRNYEPENCRWADDQTQRRNKRSSITFRGRTDTVSGWARAIGISQSALSARILVLGWPIDRALTEPRRGRKAAALRDLIS